MEGLRALAALWVVCSHLWISQVGLAAHRGLLGWASNWLLYSHLAVDVFIVLSGYCLALPAVRDGGQRGGPMRFWGRRARRILPPLYLSLAFAIGVTLLLQTLDHVPRRVDPAALGVNLCLVQDLFLKDNVFDSPLWSVAVEWRLSLVFPLLLWLLRRGGVGTLLLVSAGVSGALTAAIFRHAPQMLMASPWYLLLFAMGICAASASAGPAPSARPPEASPLSPIPPWVRRWALAGGAAALLAWSLWAHPIAATGTDFGRHMPVTDAAVGTLAALLLCGLGRTPPSSLGGTALRRLLTWPSLVAVGNISYSIYLTHDPTLHLLERLLRPQSCWMAAAGPLKFLLLASCGLPLIVALAALFYWACERPFLSRRPPLAIPWNFPPSCPAPEGERSQ